MAASKSTFGTVMHADLLGAKPGFLVPDQLDASILHPEAETRFLSDDVKIALGIPLTHRPRMAIVDDTLFKQYLARMVDSATKLEELMAAYEELENSTPGMNHERLHATVQQSVQLISHVKLVPVHVALDGIGRWLKRQAYEIERTQSELDTFDDAEVCVSQGDEEITEREARGQNSQDAGVRDTRASLHSAGHGGGKSRTVGAVKRGHAATPAKQQMATGTPTSETAAVKASNAARALQTPAAVKSVHDPTETQDGAGPLASPWPVPNPLPSQAGQGSPAGQGTPFGQGTPAVANLASGTTSGSGKSPRGNKKPQEGVTGGAAAASGVSVPELEELRGTVAKQSKQLEQMSAKLKESEVNAAQALSRTAHLEACLQSEGIDIPEAAMPAFTSGTAPASMPKNPAAGSDQQRSPGQTGARAGGDAADGGRHPEDGDVRGRTSKADAAGVGLGSKGSRSSKTAASAKAHVKSAQAGSKSKQTKAQPQSGAKAARTGQEQSNTDGPAYSSDGHMAQPFLGQQGHEDDVTTEEATPRSDTSSAGDKDIQAKTVANNASVENTHSHKRSAAKASKHDISQLQKQLSELKKTVQAKDAQISSMQKDMDEMSQALGAAIATVDTSGATGKTTCSAPKASQPTRTPQTKHRDTAQTNMAHTRGMDGTQMAAGTAMESANASDTAGSTKVSPNSSQQKTKPLRAPKVVQSHGAMTAGHVSADGTLIQQPDDISLETADSATNDTTEDTDRTRGAGPGAHTSLDSVTGFTSSDVHTGKSGSSSTDGVGGTCAQKPGASVRASARAQTVRTRPQDPAVTLATGDDVDAGICPRCAELEKHLRYWREREWFKKARDLKWEKLWARRREIPINLSHFTGILKMADELEGAGSLLGMRRSGGFGRPLSAYMSRAPSRRNSSRGRSGAGALPGSSHDQGLRLVNSLQAPEQDDDPQSSQPASAFTSGCGLIRVDSARHRSDSPTEEGPLEVQDSSSTLAPVVSGITFDGAVVAAAVREGARPVRTLTSTMPSASHRSQPSPQPAPGQLGPDAQISMVPSQMHTHEGQVLYNPEAGKAQVPPPVEGQSGPDCDAARASDDTGIPGGSGGAMEDAHGSHTGQGDDLVGRSAVSFVTSDHQTARTEGQTRHVPGTRPDISAEPSPAADDPGRSVDASKCLLQHRDASGDGQMHREQLRRSRSRDNLGKGSTHVPSADLMGSIGDVHSEEQPNGASRASSGSHAHRGRLHGGHARPFSSEMQASPLESPFVVKRDPESSPERRRSSAGNKLSKPVVRERQNQRVDLASLKLQGMCAHAASRDVQAASHGLSPKKSQRQSSSGGRLLKTPRRFQVIAAKQLRSFKLLGSRVKSANGGMEEPED